MTTKPTSAAASLQSSIVSTLQRIAGLFTDDRGAGSFSRTQRLALLALVLLAAVVRFWGVGSFGLHAPDEGTTALPALHILEDGRPRFPGGMLYTRAVAHLYMIAGSVLAFGNSEWSLRLPSVLCGTLLVLLVVPMGRRFLSPGWSLAFAAVAAGLPALITDSQVVRMYIFLIATLAVYSHWVFRWEATGRGGYAIAAVVTMLIGIHFHQLAIFGSLVLFMPALVKGDARLLRQACVAFIPIMAYFVYIRWTPSEYPLPITDFAVPETGIGRAPVVPGLRFQPLWTLLVLAACGIGAWLLAWRAPRRSQWRWLAALVLLIGLCAAGMFYHVAALLLVASLVLAARQGRLDVRWAVGGITLLALLAAWQLHTLLQSGPESMRKALGVMVGQPSVWQYVAAAGFSRVATLLVVGGVAWAALRLARRRRLPDVWLYFTLAVAVPLFLMGLTDWFFPPRYVEFALLPLLLTALTVAQMLWRSVTPRARGWHTGLAATLVALAVINPLAMARAVNAGAGFADHRGAALYVKAQLQSQQGGAPAIVIAEDVLYPWYYLGHVDYWLMGRAAAKNFAQRVDGQVVYQYTHTPLLGTAAELQALLGRPDRGTVYIIGSGDDMADGRRFLRGDEIADLLASGRLPLAFTARDGLTRVWRIPPPAADPP